MTEDDEKYFHKLLDRLNVPIKSKAGVTFTFFGRLLILIEKLVEFDFKYE